MTIKLITDLVKLDAAITSIGNRGKKLDRDIWIAAASAINHHAEHGDYARINNLIAAMPKGARVNALREYFTAFSGCDYDEEAKVFLHVKGKPVDLEGACATSWTDFKPEPEYKPFDAAKAIAAMLKKVDAADPDKGDKVSPAQAKAIRDMAAALGVEA